MWDRRLASVPFPDGPVWPGEKGPHIFLLDASSTLERKLLEAWISRHRPEDADVQTFRIPATRRRTRRVDLDPEMEACLENGSDPLLTPLRVVWLAPERDGRRRVGFRDLVTLGDPRDPDPIRQWFILRFRSDRCRIVRGEPARVSQLRRRWGEKSVAGSSTSFATYTALQGWLALERAERGLRGSRYKVPKFLREDLFGSPRFQAGIVDLAEQEGVSVERMRRRTRRYLREIAATHSPFVIDLITGVTGWLINRAHREFAYDPAELEALYEMGQRHPLVFLPSHKSNFDHLVLQYVLYENGLPPNHTAGGINMDFFPVGPLVRRSGIFFIRRQLKDNEPYKFVLRQYIDYLVEKRFPLEWYIEGGRSRTGKLREPRLGMLSYVVDAYRRGLTDDIILIPVSIAYDQIADVDAYVAEQRGGDKEKESFSWVLRLIRGLRKRYGGIYLRFGRPLSLRTHLGRSEEVDLSSETGRLVVPKLAFEVATRINEATPITPISLVTLALLSCGGTSLTISETLEVLKPFLDYVKRRDLPTTVPLALDTPERVTSAMEELVDNDVVTEHVGPSATVYGIDPDQHLAAAYYRNTIIHFFINRAIAELAVASMVSRGRTGQDVYVAEALRLRDVLKFEFFFPDREEFSEEILDEAALEDPEWRSHLGDTSPQRLLSSFRPYMAPAVLRPFLDAYKVVADVIAKASPDDELEPKHLQEAALALGRQYLVQGRINSEESVSTTLFAGGVQLAKNRRLLAATPEGTTPREEFAAQLNDLADRFSLLPPS